MRYTLWAGMNHYIILSVHYNADTLAVTSYQSNGLHHRGGLGGGHSDRVQFLLCLLFSRQAEGQRVQLLQAKSDPIIQSPGVLSCCITIYRLLSCCIAIYRLLSYCITIYRLLSYCIAIYRLLSCYIAIYRCLSCCITIYRLLSCYITIII